MTVPEAAATETRRLRRELGPTAWVVLEELVATVRPGDGAQLVRTVTAVGLAAELGIGRDAAVAALGRLRRRGLVAFQADRQTGTGRFGSGRYVVTAAAAALVSGLGASPPRDAPAAIAAVGAVPVRKVAAVVSDSGHRRVSPKPGRAVAAVGRLEAGGKQGSLFDLSVDADGCGATEPEWGGAVGAGDSGGGGGEGRLYRHELASPMPPVAGDIGDDIDPGGQRC